MTENNTDLDPPAPPNEVTDASLGSADNPVDHDDNTEPILRKILEELAGDDSTKGEAESLRDWIAVNEGTRQGLQMKDLFGRTPLHFAVVRGLSAAATKLIRAGATLNAQDQDGETPLYKACNAENKDIVELLLDKGADTTLTDEDKKTPLYVAAEVGHKIIAERILKKSKETLNWESNFYKWTPLHIAASNGHEEVISYLRDEGARLDLQDEDGWTPLWTAVTWEEARAIEALTKKKDNDEDLELETGNSDGRTPLMEAARRGFWEGARLLVEAGAKCDKSESTDTIREDTALHLAVSANQFEIVQFLLRSGANINARNADGQHSSHLASIQGNEGILKLLLDTTDSSGLNARDEDGMTPLHLASNADMSEDDESDNEESNSDESGDDEQESSGTTANAPIDDNISTEEPGRYIQVVRLLLRRNADTTAVTNDDRTALELAFYSGHGDIVEAILNSLEGTSAQFSHALRRAASDTKRHTMAISLLQRQLKQSGNSLPSDSESWPAIQWAAHMEDPDALWLLIASSLPNDETKNAIKLAKDLVDLRDQSAKDNAKPKNQKRDGADDTKKRDKVSLKEDLIRDIITNPPTGLMCSDNQEYSIPSSEEKIFSEDYKATVVQFREQQGRFGSIIKSQNVKKTIYTEGPKKIMDGAVSKLEEQAKKLAEWKVKQDSSAPSSANFNKPKSKQGSTAQIFIDSNKPLKFTWVHLPATNMAWMDGLLQRIMKDEDKSASEFNQAKSFFKDSWIEVPDKVSPSRIMRPQCVWRDTQGTRTMNENSSKKGPLEPGPDDSRDKDETTAPAVAAPSLMATAIYIPYFSYSFHCGDEHQPSDEARNAEKPPKAIKEPIAHPTEFKEPILKKRMIANQNGVKLNEKEIKFEKELIKRRAHHQGLLDAYKDKIVHRSSTLDESYYHFGDEKSEEDRKRRNRTQVVTDSWYDMWHDKWNDSRDHGRPEHQGLHPYWPLIRVNQLWIWTIDDKWLISASSHPIDDHEDELLKGVLDLLEKQGKAGGSGLQPSSASEMSQIIVDYCVESYERKPQGLEGDRPTNCRLENLLSIRQTFSKSINSIARGETDLFGTFSKLTKELRTASSLKEQSKDVDGPSLDVQLAEATDKAEDLAKTVKDIIDELNILEATAHYQQDVQRAMKAMKKQELQSTIKGIKKDKIPETDLTATYVINDIKRLDSVAKRVHDAVNTTLSLQQSEVANLQARLSLAQADASARQGRVLMVFTVVTIVFLPLSFLTSFFALDVSSFQPEAWAVGIIFSVSIAFSIPTVILAFTWKQSKKFMQKQLDWISNKKQIGDGGSNPDPRGSGTCPPGANKSCASLTRPHQIGNQEQSTSNGTELNLEKVIIE